MNTKTIKNLVHLQRKMSVNNKYLDIAFPFLGVAFIMFLGFIMSDDFEVIKSEVTMVTINMAAITSTQMAVQVYFGRYKSMNLNTLPATNAEKFASIICVILLRLIQWAVALLIGSFAMCIIGTYFYDVPSSQVVALSLEEFTNPVSLILLLLVVAGFLMWFITQYVDIKLKYSTRITMAVCILPMILILFLPEDITAIVALPYFTFFIVAAYVWNYYCFKRTQPK